MSKRNYVIFGIIAITIGIIRIPTLFCDFPLLSLIGETLAISPFPVPYNHPMVTTPEDRSRGLSFYCEKSGQGDFQAKWNHYVRGKLSGPHRRTITFVSYFDSATQIQDDVDEDRFEALSRYYFCNNGPLAVAAGCPENIDAIRLTYRDQQIGETIRERRVSCRH